MFVTVEKVNAFTDNSRGGNPAGIVVDADGLSAVQKQYVAQKTGLSETAFISKSDVADFKLDFFTPTRQIAHCGHATIAAFSWLLQLGKVKDGPSSKETIDGTRAIMLEKEAAFMEQKSPLYEAFSASSVDYAAILSSLGITSHDLLSGLTPHIVSTGNRFMIVPLKDKNTARDLQPNMEAIKNISTLFNLVGYYIFSTETDIPGRDAATRMFAPAYGINEESATGMAAGPLACFFHDIMGIQKNAFLIEQGRLMQQPSESLISVHLETNESKTASLMVGGKAHSIGSLKIEI